VGQPAGPIVGIDLGTTFSGIAFLNAFGRAEVVPTATGERELPSVVLFPPGGAPPIVGRAAKERSTEHPDRVVEFVKRDMGDPDWRFRADGRELTAPLVSSIILRARLDQAQARLGERPSSAVVTVPAYFGDLERQATLDAGRLAGLEVLSTFNEPTAAALAYGLHQAARDDTVRALVYDLGGGTFDVTVLELRGRRVRVLATAGEHRLGGKDWDDELVNHCAEVFAAEHGLDPRDDLVAQQDLRNRAEAAKVTLSTKPRATVFVRAQGKTSKVEVTRQRFEELTRPLLLQTKTYLDQVLAASSTRWQDIHVVLPVGGSSYMPQVRDLLRQASGRDPEHVIDPELAVVQGACYYAALLRAQQGFEVQVLATQRPAKATSLDDAPTLLSLPGEVGAATEPWLPALPPATPLFAVAAPAGEKKRSWIEESLDGLPMLGGRTAVFDFADLVQLDPGLPASAGVVQEVNARALGVLVYAQGKPKTSVMIPANTPLPATTVSKFHTIQDRQTAVKVVVLEGDSPDPAACVRVGECVIDGLPPRPKGQAVEVAYSYDHDGRIRIDARDVGSGQRAMTTLHRATDGMAGR
jgi:molecular chaperone DnaK